MVRVPEYQGGGVALRPEMRQDLEVKAKPEAFGWDVGHGMVGAAKGIENLGNAVSAVQDIENATRAKEGDNAFSAWARERMYGENGFMTMEGRNAVDGRAAFEREAEEKRREIGRGLTPGAAKYYGDASNARLQSILQNSVTHTAAQRKVWVDEASKARVATFNNDALVNSEKPDLVDKNVAAAQAELRQRAQLHGWDADTLKTQERATISKIYTDVILKKAATNATEAQKYRQSKADMLSGGDALKVDEALKPRVEEEETGIHVQRAEKLGRNGNTADGTASPPRSGRTLAEAGPTKVRAFLISKAGGAARKVDGLDEGFATNLGAMFQDAPPNIRDGLQVGSGFRSYEQQKAAWDKSDQSGHMVARPGNSSHEFGKAVDIWYNGVRLDKAPAEVRDWVHANAGKYGMTFRMGHEPWHIEPVGARQEVSATISARRDGVSPRAQGMSNEQMIEYTDKIQNPNVREATLKALKLRQAMRDGDAERVEKDAKKELWRLIDEGVTPDRVPMEVRQAAGMASVSAAYTYMEAAAQRREIKSEETLVYSMRKYAAMEPGKFAEIDLNEYRDRLSKDHIKEFTEKQTTALTDQRKAREEGLNLSQAFSQSETMLEAAGIIQSGKQGKAATQKEAERISQFNNALSDEMAAFQKREGKPPSQMDIQAIRKKLLLPIVIGKPASFSFFPFMTTFESVENKFVFDARIRPDNTTVAGNIKYGDIPIDYRRGIATDLERQLGRKPSEKEVISRYQAFVLDR